MRYDVIAFCDDQLVLIMERLRHGADEIEQSFAAWCYVCAVLNVVRRPELLGCDEVLPVEQGLERFEDKRLVSLGSRFAHSGSPWFCRQRFFLPAWPGIEIMLIRQKLQKKHASTTPFQESAPMRKRLALHRVLRINGLYDHKLTLRHASTGLQTPREN